jgi:hypothetical protein
LSIIVRYNVIDIDDKFEMSFFEKTNFNEEEAKLYQDNDKIVEKSMKGSDFIKRCYFGFKLYMMIVC